ncbi:hypothetical protein AC579_4631 [Pseudocercospora musae]|uniref:Uncharacterized protein n=1 Tax=Pseudocercospora musae TaxID=113226 RepID=A0A139IB70_9PEZI|nr:hypothetical protein AC579_4631 [Pseudocercospora musae]
MCTQELIWCSCGHGEFLPIRACPRGRMLSYCYTIVHGSHKLIVPGECSYCKSGLNRRKQLPAARPPPDIAAKVEENAKIEDNQKDVFEKMLTDPEYWPDDGAFPTAENAFELVEDTVSNMNDVMDTDFVDFELDPELLELPLRTKSQAGVERDGQKS